MSSCCYFSCQCYVRNEGGLQNVQARADSILASFGQEQKAQLKDRACSLGLPTAVTANCKDFEVPRIILGGLSLLAL